MSRRRVRCWCGWTAPGENELEAFGWHRVECASPGWTAREVTTPLEPVRSKPKLGPPRARYLEAAG